MIHGSPYTKFRTLPGRSERAFRTLQDRLPKELALAGIATLAAANRWIAEHYLAEHNAAFAVAAAEAGSAFVADRTGQAAEILLPPGRAPGRQRQYRAMAWPQLADPAEPIAGALCPRHRAGA